MLLPSAVAAVVATSNATGDARLLGLNIHQSASVGVAVTQRCKGQVVRVDFNWYAAEPSQGVYDWTVLDAVVNASVARGFTVIATAAYTPGWAASGGDAGTTNSAVPVTGTYASFIAAAVAHFATVTHWELWNEPNLPQFFQGSAEDYVQQVLVPGAAAVHAACPSCKVLGPALATVGTNYADWMQTVLTEAGPSIDVVTGHDYAWFDDMGGGGATNPDFFSKLDHHRVLKLGDAVVYADPLSLRESMVLYGAADKPFWMTETGYEATYGDAAAMATQAQFASEVLEAMVTRPWWGATVFYDAFDVAGQPSSWGFSLADPDASLGYLPKPVCGVLADPPDFDAAIPPDAEADGAEPLDAGRDATVRVRDGGSTGAHGGARDATVHADAGDAGPAPAAASSGCACRMEVGPRAWSGAWTGGMIALLPALRRRRRCRYAE